MNTSETHHAKGEPPLLSIVIPAYNEEQRLGPTLAATLAYLKDRPFSSELIIVDDGSTDGTWRLARELIDRTALDERIQTSILSYVPNAGKGKAVRTGVLATTGHYVGFIDADLSVPVEEIDRALEYLSESGGYDIVMASRAVAGSEVLRAQPLYRRLSAKLFNALRDGITGIRGLSDTQCGLKVCRGPVARWIFARQVINGFMFDVETLFIAQRAGLAILEIGVPWTDAPGSKVKLSSGLRLLPDLLRIRRVHGRLSRAIFPSSGWERQAPAWHAAANMNPLVETPGVTPSDQGHGVTPPIAPRPRGSESAMRTTLSQRERGQPSNSTVLVTGGAGFIGSHTVDALLARGHRVRVIDKLTPRIHGHGKPAYLPPEVEFIQGDVSDRRSLSEALEGVRFVYHFAAYQDYLPDFSTFFHVNAESTALLFELMVANRLPVEKVIVASSQAVYGEGRYRCSQDGMVWPDLRDEGQLQRGEWDPPCPRCGGPIQWQPTDESHAKPQNAYGLSKHAQEATALTLGKRYRIPTVALRYSIVQGPRQSFYNAYSGVCRIFSLSLFFGQRPTVYEDGQQVRDYVNIRDVVAANLLVLDRPEADYRVFNVGGGRAYTVLEFADIVARVFGVDISPEVPGTYRFGDTRHILSDISRLGELGWVPQRTAEESVRDYVAWLREQENVEDILDYTRRHMDELNVVRSVRG